MLTICSKETNDVSTLYLLQVAKYNKNEFQNLQDLKETREGLFKFQFKLGYVEEQLFVAVSMNCYKNGSFMKMSNKFYKIIKSCITEM